MKHWVYSFTVAFISLLPLFPLAAQRLVGSWQPTDTLSIGRTGHRAVVVTNGDVLVSGGAHEFEYLASCEIYSISKGRWLRTGAMQATRYYHTATELSNGMVLAAGGYGQNGINRTCEIYDPERGSWKATGSMKFGRRIHTATFFPEGIVLVAGGDDGENTYRSCEIYDEESRCWTMADSMSIPRVSHTATLLDNGMLLVTGGDTRIGDKLISASSCELFDPEIRRWRTTSPMHIGRSNHSAVLLNDGRVMVIGGVNDKRGELRSCEIYDPQTERWSTVDSISVQRVGHGAVRLADGKVMIVGGFNSEKGRTYLEQCEIYDPLTNQWNTAPPISNPATTPTLSVLTDGRVLMTGGFSMIQYPLYTYWSHCALFDYNTRNTLAVDQEREPGGLLLMQSYPNPAAAATTIRYMLPRAEHVALKIYDVNGRQIASLVEETQEAGVHEARFDASTFPDGTYYYRCTAGTSTRIQEMIVTR